MIWLSSLMFVHLIFICLYLRFSHSVSLCFAFVVDIIIIIVIIDAAVSKFVNLPVRDFDLSWLVPANRDETTWLPIIFPHFPGIGQITLNSVKCYASLRNRDYCRRTDSVLQHYKSKLPFVSCFLRLVCNFMIDI